MGNIVCPHCGFDPRTAKKYAGVLPPFSILNGRYLLGRVLGRGGFGVTYIAKDLATNRICAIKEYWPSEYSSRSSGTKNITPFSDPKAQHVFRHGREKFVEEVRILEKLRNHPIIVDIWAYFQENNTAYLVMEFLDGQNLRELAKQNGGKINTEQMKEIFVIVASALMEIHRLNILHRDLSPENIILTRDGSVKLIDFGAARNFVSTQNAGMSILLKPGFAPPEQYEKKGAHGPWSDVYALCATFYNLVSGRPLVDALFRYRGQEQPSLTALGCNVTQRTSDVIQKGLELDYKRRYQDFGSLLKDIDIKTSNTKTGKEQKIPEEIIEIKKESKDIKKDTREKHAYVAAVIRNGLFNKVTVPKGDFFKIGRSAQNCHYTITGDTNISRLHCYLRFDGENIYLTDDKSANGTFFENGSLLKKNKEYLLTPGTRFYLATPNHMLTVGVE